MDVVVTLSEEAEACWKSLPASAPRFHWPLPDPSQDGIGPESLGEFRALRDEIEARVRALLSNLCLLQEESGG